MPTTPNMTLSLPDVGVTTGPEYAAQLNIALGVEGTGVDGHDHSPGKGVPITPAGMDVTDDIDMQEHTLLNTLSVDFVSQTVALDGTNQVYVLDGDFYMLDGNGVSIRITENGAISAASFGAITGLTSPASASFATDTFTWLYDTSKYALMASGPLLLRRDGETSPHRIKITPPASLASDYDLTLPAALPGSNSYLYSDATGQLAFSTTALLNSVDTAAIQSQSVTTAKIADGNVSTVKIAGSAITTAKILDANVTRAKLESVGQQVSTTASSLSGGTASSMTNITNLTVSITVTTTRPIMIVGTATSDSAALQVEAQTGGSAQGRFQVAVSGSATGTVYIGMLRSPEPVGAGAFNSWPPSALNCVYVPSGAGTFTFQAQYSKLGSTAYVYANDMKLLAYQL